MDNGDPDWTDQLAALRRVGAFQPVLTGGIIILGAVAALLEGVGLSFLLPIIELAQSGGQPNSTGGGLSAAFARGFEFLGVPFTLEFIVAGVAVVMLIRYSASLTVAWCRELIRTRYERHLKAQAFDRALSARVSYFDEKGSDEILNAIVTQAAYAGKIIRRVVRFFEIALISLMYLLIALYIAPLLTALSLGLMGGLTFLIRNVVEPAYSVGDRVANANEAVQSRVQAGSQGIRDVKLFGMSEAIYGQFKSSLDQYVEATLSLRRNQAIINNVYAFLTAFTVFVLIYLALSFTTLSLGSFGVFLFAMFRLAPKVSQLNDRWYEIEGDLPHLVRTQSFIDELGALSETSGSTTPPKPVTNVTFHDVTFSYPDEAKTLVDISFEADADDYIAFVGPSGAGKSTIVSLLTRLYDPDSGAIKANGTPIQTLDLAAWRDRLGVVRQDPFIFNDTLRHNIALGEPSITDHDVKVACEVARVTEFVEELPKGLDSMLGEEGIKLSGGQRQRVALARAIAKEPDVLLLDEATSELDSAIEAEVQRAVERLDCTQILISIGHRLAAVERADRIYMIEEGTVVETGTHDELMDRDGSYAELFTRGTIAQNRRIETTN